MKNKKIYIKDAATGEEIYRDMTADEIKENEQLLADELKRVDEYKAKKEQALNKLAELGITAEDLAVLGL